MKEAKFIKKCVGNNLCEHTPNLIDCGYHGCTEFDCWCVFGSPPKPPFGVSRHKRIQILGVEL